MKRFIIEKSEDEFYSSHSGLALIGLCLNRYTSLAKRLGSLLSLKKGAISHADVVRSYLGSLCLGKSDFEAISGFRQDRFFQESLGLKEIPAEPTLRQRLEDQSEAFRTIVNFCVTEFLQKSGALFSALATGHIPLDIDVFTQDNSGTKKQGVSRTCQGLTVLPRLPPIWPWKGGCWKSSIAKVLNTARRTSFHFSPGYCTRPWP